MNCPVDNEVLQMTERSGVEVDYCPRCRGIWLDRGELDKILARADRELGEPRYRDRDDDDDRDRERDDRYGDDRYRERDEWTRAPGGRRRKRKSFLSEMFEFGDD
ncbi:MAG TPA: zf-TFIIB domain-containing protein [Acidimicrobiales bacterium]|nr:zf-TFIIB domain-containing protein [Acidimicrobiales bacterium]